MLVSNAWRRSTCPKAGSFAHLDKNSPLVLSSWFFVVWAKRADLVVWEMRASAVKAARGAGVWRKGSACAVSILLVVGRAAESAVLGAGTRAGVMPLKAASALYNLGLVLDYSSRDFCAKDTEGLG